MLHNGHAFIWLLAFQRIGQNCFHLLPALRSHLLKPDVWTASHRGLPESSEVPQDTWSSETSGYLRSRSSGYLDTLNAAAPTILPVSKSIVASKAPLPFAPVYIPVPPVMYSVPEM
jgi:hypothetical protein